MPQWLSQARVNTTHRIFSPPEMIITAFRAAIFEFKPQGFSSHLKTAFFHSTPVLQHKHQPNSEFRKKRLSRSRAKQDLCRNANAFAEHLFGIWSDGFDYSDKHTSWLEKQYYRVCKRNRIGRYIPQRLDKSCFDFRGVDDGSEIEHFLRSALGGSYKERKSRWRARHFYGSNTHEESESRSWWYSNNYTGGSWGWRQRLDQEEEREKGKGKDEEYSSTDLDSSQQAHRQALGLSSSGPLNFEDVKNAYRVCALKWHPDRHHNSTKNAAEEKFKLCTVAYQSLCEKLAMK